MTSTDALSKAGREALALVTSIPQQGDAPVFNAPWEAEAFAMAVTLHEKGVFSWKEWATELSAEIAKAQAEGDPDLGDTYYLHWLSALEKLVVKKQIGDKRHLAHLYEAWDRAAKETPHGEPIVLDRSDP
ncbi:MAG: nitrile hydratase accessory protein [Granulosicoccus sp.]|nr:nitrile hydratase accessory protein [Granulosicoccus sp.]